MIQCTICSLGTSAVGSDRANIATAICAAWLYIGFLFSCLHSVFGSLVYSYITFREKPAPLESEPVIEVKAEPSRQGSSSVWIGTLSDLTECVCMCDWWWWWWWWWCVCVCVCVCVHMCVCDGWTCLHTTDVVMFLKYWLLINNLNTADLDSFLSRNSHVATAGVQSPSPCLVSGHPYLIVHFSWG